MGKPKTVTRLDNFEPGRWMTKPFTRTAEGFMTGRAIVTSVGVFTYKNAGGTETRELRLPEEVFASDSLESMKLKPVVNDHPKEKVTDENVQKYQVGSLGSNPSSTSQERTWDGYTPEDKLTDGFHVAIDMIINKTDAIEDILNGKRSLSMGYECEMEMAEPGAVWCGVAYDAIQRKIRYNHVAIVDTARAGEAARIRMDSMDAVLINQPKNQEGNSMKKFTLDGVEYEADEGVINAYKAEKARADAADKALETDKAGHAKALSTMTAERDTAIDRADKAEKALKEAQDAAADDTRLQKMLDARMTLIDAAARAGVDVKADMADTDIKKAVITAVFPNAKLDGKDDVYISAWFDAAVEDLDSRADGENREVGGSLPSAESNARADSTAARQRMLDRMLARSRGENTEG